MHDTFRAVAILVGAVLMLVTRAQPAAACCRWRDALFGVAVVVGLGGGAAPRRARGCAGSATGTWCCSSCCCWAPGVLLSVPIGFAFGLATLAYLATLTHTPLTVVVSRMDEGMSSLILLAVPLFVFLGLLIEMTGMARAMVGFLSALLGHVRGGLSYVLLGAMYLVSGISGSKAADMAAVAPVLFPEMKRRGVQRGRTGVAAGRLRRDERDDPAVPGADHHRVGDRGVDRGAVHRRADAGAGAGAALAFIARWRGRNEDMAGVVRPPWTRDLARRSSSPCPPWCCRS